MKITKTIVAELTNKEQDILEKAYDILIKCRNDLVNLSEEERANIHYTERVNDSLVNAILNLDNFLIYMEEGELDEIL